MRIPSLGIAAATLLVVLSVSPARSEAPGDVHPGMYELSRSMKQLERALRGLDRHRMRRHAAGIAAASLSLDGLVPERRRDELKRFDELLQELQDRATALFDLTKDSQPSATAAAIEDLRTTCVTCHTIFRDPSPDRGTFPARGTIVTGQLSLFKRDGKPRADASGVVVFVEGPGLREPAGAKMRRRSLSQRNRQFHPRVLPVVQGTTVDFPNDDTIFHNVFSLSKARPFDLDVYPPGKSSSVRFTKAGLVRIYCHLHPQMAASILVLPTTHFAVTDASGRFVIHGVNPGEHVLRAWHELSDGLREPVTVKEEAIVERALQLRETRTPVPHTNKFDQPYRGKYD